MKKGIRKFILAVLIGDIGAGLLMSPIKAASSVMKSAAIRYINNRSQVIMFTGPSKPQTESAVLAD